MRKLFVLLTSLVVICGLVLNGDLTFAAPRPKTFVDVAFLQKTYAEYNDTYFEGKLPRDTAIFYAPDPDEATNVADTKCSLDPQTMQPMNCSIYIAPYTNRAKSVATESLVHEMCHIETYQKGVINTNDDVSHGKVWTACMLRIAEAGGFQGVW
jgi:hypothetical protein